MVELHNFVDSIFEVFGTQTTNELLSVVDVYFAQCLIECSAAEVNMKLESVLTLLQNGKNS